MMETDTRAILRDKVDHLVVLMLENRSFDHMLGYLSLNGRSDIDGLAADDGEEFDSSHHSVRPLVDGRPIVPDPPHDHQSVTHSLEHGYMSAYKKAYPDKNPDIVLGYHGANQVPVYDLLAKHFCVCDRWFSSVPGPTWPNRLYSMAGRAPALTERTPPIYDESTFVRHLDPDDWRWYSHDPATLRLADKKYRFGHDGNFAYFDRRTLFEWSSFLDDAAHGRLRKVSWIDPNFVNFRLLGPPLSNDDHPPSPVMAGQELVLTTLRALMEGPQWRGTLLVIAYDEHGGFYDHVRPGTAIDDDASFRRVGVRVPAIVVSPFVGKGQVNDGRGKGVPRDQDDRISFDHTSIIKTALECFASDPDRAVKEMGGRTSAANDLGHLLLREDGRDPLQEREFRADLRRATATVKGWRRIAMADALVPPSEGAFDGLSALQQGMVLAAKELRDEEARPHLPGAAT